MATVATERMVGEPAAPAVLPDRARIEPLAEGDIEALARLFLSTFRRERQMREESIAAVSAYMRDLYFGSPCHRTEYGSLVYRDSNGAPIGLLGVIEMSFVLDEERLAGGMACALMVADPGSNASAGPRLMRTFVNNGLDFHATDTASNRVLAFARPMRFRLLPNASQEWFRILRPLELALEKKGERLPRNLLRPVARLADRGLRRMLPLRNDTPPGRWRDERMDMGAFMVLARRLAGGRRFRPAWDEAEFAWMLGLAAEKRAGGDLAFRRVVDDQGGLAGCYAVYARPGGVAQVLHLLPEAKQAGVVLDALLRHVDDVGCAAVRGSTEAGLMPELFRYSDILYRHIGATLVHTDRADVLAAIEADDMLIGGLAGDRWTRLISDRF